MVVPQAVPDAVDAAETVVATEIAVVEKEPVTKKVSVDESTPDAATRVRSRSKSKKRKEEVGGGSRHLWKGRESFIEFIEIAKTNSIKVTAPYLLVK